MSETPAPPDLSQRLALIIGALQKIIAARAGRHREAAPLVLLVWSYFARLTARFGSLVRRVRAGGGTNAPPRTRPESPVMRSDKPRLPTGYAWLIRLAPDAAQLTGHVRLLLADPAFSALLDAAPQAGKLLRPLCRMLGIGAEPELPAALFPPPIRRGRRPAPEPSATPPDPSPEYRPLARRYRFSAA